MSAPSMSRPASLTRLCVLSFVNQGLVFPMYVVGLFTSIFLGRHTAEEVEALVRASATGMFAGDQLEQLVMGGELLRTHGIALMIVFLLRTLGRFIGVLRMWYMRPDGFHVYTLSQLLGVLLPMIIGGQPMFSALGFVTAVMWCYLYWSQRQAITGATAP